MSARGPEPGELAVAPTAGADAHDRSGPLRFLVGLGCAHALLFLLAYGLVTSAPGIHASDDELLTFYRSGNQRRLVLAGLYVMPFAGIAFLWFSVALRTWIRTDGLPWGDLVAGAQHASGLLYVGLFFAAAAASAVTAVSVEYSRGPLDPVVARQFHQYSATLLLGFAMRMAAMYVFTTSRLGRANGVLPSWFALLGLAVGLGLLLSPSFSRLLVLVFPLWLLVLCALLLARAPRLAPVTRS